MRRVVDLLFDGARVSAVSPHPFVDSSIQMGLCGHLDLPTPSHLAVINDFEVVPSLFGIFFVADDEGHHVQLDMEVRIGARTHHPLDMYLDFWGQGSLGLDD